MAVVVNSCIILRGVKYDQFLKGKKKLDVLLCLLTKNAM